MRLSRQYMPTLREDPAEADVVSHRLLLRAGMLRKTASGIYSYLPLGRRVLLKVETIVREEMDRAGALEVLLPAVQPADIWQASGRWDEYGPEMMRLKDRHDRDFCLGPTHEELITTLVKDELRSYRDLPRTLYQIQVKFRDEIRPRFGLMRGREFLMKDAYSFDEDQAGLERSYRAMYDAYSRILERCGLEYRAVRAKSGLIGGDVSQEFMVVAETGEEVILYCPQCDYAANREFAVCGAPADAGADRSAGSGQAAQGSNASSGTGGRGVDTPGKTSVKDVAEALGVTPRDIIKTLIYRTADGPVAVLVRGDREVDEARLAEALGEDAALLAEEDFPAHRLVPGFVGPVGLPKPVAATIMADRSIDGMTDAVVGANQPGRHLAGVVPGADFRTDRWVECTLATAGDPCPGCGTPLSEARGIEVGHVFQLGTKYSKSLDATFVDRMGENAPFIMGCYGIGVSRMVAAAVEQSHDDSGIVWPMSLAPGQVIVVALGREGSPELAAAEALYHQLADLGIEVVLDDRAETPGVKFSDADLVGWPIQAILGKKSVAAGEVEIKARATGARSSVRNDQAAQTLAGMVHSELAVLGIPTD